MESVDAGNTAWLLCSTALVLLMTPGLAFFYGGLVHSGNVLNTMMMSLISMGVVAIPWCLLGFSLAFGTGSPLIGDFAYIGLHGLEDSVWPETAVPALLFVAFQMAFAIIGAAIISGAVVERMRFSAYIIFIFLWSLVVYAPVCHWVWGPGGWIDELGAKDFAGGTVVHECTGTTAFVLAALLGPGRARAHTEKAQPHSVPFVILGGALLWFGWLGFNGGSALAADFTAALAVLNTCLAAAASLVVWVALVRVQHRYVSAVGAVTGFVVGLVIITPAAGFVTPMGAMVMGAVGCCLAYPAFQLEIRWVDDRLDAFVCHGVSGFIGTLLTGVFATDGGLAYGGGFQLLGAQIAGGLATAAYSALASGALFWAISRCFSMRVPEEHECHCNGLDCIVHGESAYGDGAFSTSTKAGSAQVAAKASQGSLGNACEACESAAGEAGGAPSPEQAAEQV